jgi:hypothetical protein
MQPINYCRYKYKAHFFLKAFSNWSTKNFGCQVHRKCASTGMLFRIRQRTLYETRAADCTTEMRRQQLQSLR